MRLGTLHTTCKHAAYAASKRDAKRGRYLKRWGTPQSPPAESHVGPCWAHLQLRSGCSAALQRLAEKAAACTPATSRPC